MFIIIIFSNLRFYGHPVLLLFLVFIFSCKPDLQQVTVVTERQHLPVETANDIEFFYSDSGFMRIKLTAPELLRFEGEDPYTELPKGVHLIFYNERMLVESWLSANYAISYEKTKIMEAKGNVIVVNKKGEKLNTEKLTWDEEKKIIYTDVFVKITTMNEIIMGYGLEANEDFTRFSVKNIKGTIQVQDEETGTAAE